MAIAGSFQEFIQRPDSHKIYIADMRLMHRSGNGTPETYDMHFSTESYFPPPGSVIDYTEALLGIPSYERSTQEIFSGQSFPSFGPVILANNSGTLDSTFTGSYTKDQRFVMRLGGPSDEISYGNFGTVLVGIMGMQQNISDKQIEIPIYDDQRRLNIKIPTTVYSRSEYGATFPDGSEGVPKAVIYGEVHNFKPTLIDASTLKYGVAGHAIQAVGTVYDNGANITANATIDLTNATFTLSARPSGIVTCDVKGRKTQAGTYTDRVIGLVESLLIQEGGYSASEIDQATMRTMKSVRNYKAGIAITQQKTIMEVIDELIAGLLVFYGHNRSGSFDMRQFMAPSGTSVLTFQDDVEVQETFSLNISEPKYHVEIGYDNNETVMQENALAGTVPMAAVGWFTQPYRTATLEDTTVRGFYPYSEAQPPVVTRLLTKADAGSIALEYLNLVKTERRIIKAPFGVQPLQVDLGDVVTFTRPRYGICGQWRVMGIREDYVQNTVELEIFQ